MDQQRLGYLFSQYQENQLSKEEQREWIDVLADPMQKNAINELAKGIFERDDLLGFQIDEEKARHILTAILNYPQLHKQKGIVLWKRVTTAAAILIVTAAGLLYLSGYMRTTVGMEDVAALNDIVPGKQGATLTLANGKKIRLSNALNGTLAKEEGISVKKTADGQLIYVIEAAPTKAQTDVVGKSPLATYNTLSTANGETYKVSLPDGSLVVLNARSSLTYSASLIERGKRQVKLSGEAYFEISKDKAHPFVVRTNNQEVEVLGTHFNINSYDDEGVEKTTLLEGSIKMTASGVDQLLKPGQQGKLERNKIHVSDVDTDLAVAWKNNEFTFESESITTVMKMVERWYNVEVVYIGDKTTEKFSGRVSRFDNASKLLKIVESTGYVHFKIEGRKIYVSQP